MHTKDAMLAALSAHRPGMSLDQKFYADEEFYRLDLENLFYREWLFIGHDCEIATPGQYFTAKVGDYSIIVLRGADGVVRALHNSCRHRGSRICPTDRGSVKRLICPYHQWTYDLDGALIRARHIDGDVDKPSLGLKRVHCETVGGYIFVCFAATAPSFAPFRAQVESYLAPHRIAEAKVAFTSTIIEEGNWKLVWENNRECYHCAANHPELCRTFPETPVVSGIEGAMKDPVLRAHWEHCESAGLPSVFNLSASGQHRVSRVPLLDEAESYTMSGREAVGRALSDDVTTNKIGALLMFHYPSIWNHVLRDHAVSFRVLPLGPTKTEVTTKWLVHKDAVEGKDYSLEELTEVWIATNDQDRRVVQENQIGILSPAYEPGPYAPAHESGVEQFVDWYLAAMRDGLERERVRLSRVA